LLGSDTELALQVQDQLDGGFTSLRVVLGHRGSQDLCLSGDGFSEFHRVFLEAVHSGDRQRIANHFAYPFTDGLRAMGVIGRDLGMKNAEEFLKNYDSFFGSDEHKKPIRPSEFPECRRDMSGYVDWQWLPRSAVLAQRLDGEWKWTAIPYTP
jgi:hypothetical protein